MALRKTSGPVSAGDAGGAEAGMRVEASLSAGTAGRAASADAPGLANRSAQVLSVSAPGRKETELVAPTAFGSGQETGVDNMDASGREPLPIVTPRVRPGTVRHLPDADGRLALTSSAAQAAAARVREASKKGLALVSGGASRSEAAAGPSQQVLRERASQAALGPFSASSACQGSFRPQGWGIWFALSCYGFTAHQSEPRTAEQSAWS